MYFIQTTGSSQTIHCNKFYRLVVNFQSSRCDCLKLFDLLVGLEVEDDQEQEGAQDLDEEVHPEDVDADVVRVLPQPRNFRIQA